MSDPLAMMLAEFGAVVSIRPMAEPGQRNGVWGVLGVLGVLGLLAAVSSASSTDQDDEDGDDLVDDEPDVRLPPGRDFELALVSAFERRHGDRVLDNPRVTARDGRLMKPDVVVLERGGRSIREVREAKDVGVLQEAHVWQAVRYDEELSPNRGTSIDVPERTFVPPEVAALAKLLDIEISRWRKTA